MVEIIDEESSIERYIRKAQSMDFETELKEFLECMEPAIANSVEVALEPFATRFPPNA